MKLTTKQTRALDYLEDKFTTEVLYGGAAGGGKSFFGCYWLLKNCLRYAGTRWLMGRTVLKTLKETTLNSFFQVCKMQGITSASYNYNIQAGTITFFNGSQILLKDLDTYPSDPDFDSLGSLEITGAFIDECNQVSLKAKNIVKSRIRYKLDEHKLLPKILMTCNPAKNWVYTEFYKPSREGKLAADKQFIQALVTDNPNISKHYIVNLQGLDQQSRRRLLHGDWEYDNEADRLFDYNSLCELFSNMHVLPGIHYITADVARMGSDKAVIVLWAGMVVEEIYTFDKSATTDIEDLVRALSMKHSVPMSRVVVDEDGVGGGVVDHLRCMGFVNNSRPLRDENFVNLKAQCFYKLAAVVNSAGIYIRSQQHKQEIIQELEAHRRKDMDKDDKLAVIPKEKVKEIIGRSPDFADALMMRMYFELHQKVQQIAW